MIRFEKLVSVTPSKSGLKHIKFMLFLVLILSPTFCLADEEEDEALCPVEIIEEEVESVVFYPILRGNHGRYYENQNYFIPSLSNGRYEAYSYIAIFVDKDGNVIGRRYSLTNVTLRFDLGHNMSLQWDEWRGVARVIHCNKVMIKHDPCTWRDFEWIQADLKAPKQ